MCLCNKLRSSYWFLYICLFVYLFNSLDNYFSVWMSNYLFICLGVYSSVQVFIRLYVCLYTYLFGYNVICMGFCLCFRMSIPLYVWLFICGVYLFIWASIHMSGYIFISSNMKSQSKFPCFLNRKSSVLTSWTGSQVYLLLKQEVKFPYFLKRKSRIPDFLNKKSRFLTF